MHFKYKKTNTFKIRVWKVTNIMLQFTEVDLIMPIDMLFLKIMLFSKKDIIKVGKYWNI